MVSGEHNAITALTEQIRKLNEGHAVTNALLKQTAADVSSMKGDLVEVKERVAVGSEKFRNTDRRISAVEKAADRRITAIEARCQREQDRGNERLWQVIGWVAPLLVSGAIVAYAAFLTPIGNKTSNNEVDRQEQAAP